MFNFLKSYFSFTRSQQNGIIVLALLIAVLIAIPYLVPFFVKQPKADFSGFRQDIEAFEKQDAQEEIRPIEQIELNSADSAQLMALNGIGTVLSKRIVKYRNILGGYVNVEQLKEVYGLEGTTFQKIKPSVFVDTTAVKKIPINTIPEEELKIHPYFRKNVAKEICAYRKQHGNFKSMEELKNAGVVDEKLFLKIRPYLTLQ